MRCAIGTFLAVCVFAGQDVPAPVKTPGWRPVMNRLNACAAELPAEQRTDVQTPLNWMNAQFELANRPMPATYRESLERDAEICEAALKQPGNSQLVQDLIEDLRNKGRDCIEHGWYRNVRVQVETLRGGKAEPGWEIHYMWIPGRNLPSPQKVRFKALSPSEESLPPGLYAFHARKEGRASEETRVAVVSKDSVLCQIPVP